MGWNLWMRWVWGWSRILRGREGWKLMHLCGMVGVSRIPMEEWGSKYVLFVALNVWEELNVWIKLVDINKDIKWHELYSGINAYCALNGGK